MDEKQLEEVKAQLLKRKKELEEELARLYTEKMTDDQVQDLGDQAVTSSMEALRSSLQDKDLAEYTMIVKAIENLQSGEYGICSDCGQPISPKRLKVYPNATRCLICQEAQEGL